jgi:hypothetical protein
MTHLVHLIGGPMLGCLILSCIVELFDRRHHVR